MFKDLKSSSLKPAEISHVHCKLPLRNCTWCCVKMKVEFNYYWSMAWVPLMAFSRPQKMYILFRYSIVCHNLSATTVFHCCCCYLGCVGATKYLMLLANALVGSWPIVVLQQVQDWDFCGPIMLLQLLSSYRTCIVIVYYSPPQAKVLK